LGLSCIILPLLHLILQQGAWWFHQLLFSPVSPQIETLTWCFRETETQPFPLPHQVTPFPFCCVINLIHILCLMGLKDDSAIVAVVSPEVSFFI